MYELNNLRVLNDYLNQTIDALLRAQRFGAVGAGISHSPYAASHSPYAAAASLFGSPVGVAGIGVDPTLAGLSHSAAAYASPFASAYGSAFAPHVNATPFSSTFPVVDPFIAQRGLNHSSVVGGWQPWSPIAEMARQQQLTQAIAARQSILEAIWRTAGIPV